MRPAFTPASKPVLDLPTPEGWKAELTNWPKLLGIFGTNFIHLSYAAIYAKLQIFIQLPLSVKLCHTKCDHPACASTDGGHFEHIIWRNLVKVTYN